MQLVYNWRNNLTRAVSRSANRKVLVGLCITCWTERRSRLKLAIYCRNALNCIRSRGTVAAKIKKNVQKSEYIGIIL